MNADRVMAHFERISDAPDAVDRLRRFILDLAVRGKLVEQDPEDEPAAALVRRITDSSAEQGLGKRASKPISSEAASFMAPFSTPSSWQWTTLGIATTLIRGISFSAADKSLTPGDGLLPCLRSGNIQDKVVWDGLLYVPRSAVAKKEQLVCKDDILISIANSYELVGKTAIVTDVPTASTFGAFLAAIRSRHLLPEYLQVILTSEYAAAAFRSGSAQTTNIANITFGTIRGLPVPVAPLAEQHRIVEKVDGMMTLCDRLAASQKERESRRDRLVVASLNRLSQPTEPDEFKKDARFHLSNLNRLAAKPEHIKELRKAILNLTVRGKLVPQDEREGTAAEVLDAIKRERQDLIDREEVRREKPVAPIAASEIPFSIPSTWAWSRIANIVLFTQYGTSQKGMAGKSGVPVLAMGNIQDGKVLLGKVKTIPAASEELPGLYLRQCDLLYNRTNSAELVGKTGLFLGEDDRYTFASYLIRLRPSLTATAPSFLNCVMSSPVFRETQIVPHIKKQTGQANVNGTALRNMLIPLPPLAEQKRIVAKVDELMLICDQLEAQLEYQQKGRRQLLEALLHEALEGVG